MITETHDDEGPQGGFERRLLDALTQFDMDRPEPAVGASETRRPIRLFRRVKRPVTLGLVAAFVVGCASGAVMTAANHSGSGVSPADDTNHSGPGISLVGSNYAGNGYAFFRFAPGADLEGVVSCTVGGQGTPNPDGITESTTTCLGANGETIGTLVVETRPRGGLEVFWPDVWPGGPATVWVGPLKPASDVAVSLDGGRLATFKADASGYVSEGVTMPAGVSLGKHQLRAVGVAPDGGVFDRAIELTVAPEPPDPTAAQPSPSIGS